MKTKRIKHAGEENNALLFYRCVKINAVFITLNCDLIKQEYDPLKSLITKNGNEVIHFINIISDRLVNEGLPSRVERLFKDKG